MLAKLLSRLTYANVVSTLCLFVLLGGTAYAATQLPKNSVDTKQLKKGAVTSTKVANRSLLGKDFKAGQLPAGPEGPQGVPGPQGEEGPQGQQGPEGQQGSQGPGLKTIAGTILVSSCESLNANAFTTEEIGDTCKVSFPSGSVDGFGMPFVSDATMDGFESFGDGSGWVIVSGGRPYAFVMIQSPGPAPAAPRDAAAPGSQASSD